MGRNEIRAPLKTPAREAIFAHPKNAGKINIRFSSQNFPSGKERGETDVFAGYEETVKFGFYQLIE